MREVQHHRDSSQRAEEAGNAARVADVGVNAVFLRDLDVAAEDFHPALQDGDRHPVRARERFGAVGGGGNLGGIVAGGDDLVHGGLDEVEPLLVDVHQGDFRVGKRGEREYVPHQATSEAETAGS